MIGDIDGDGTLDYVLAVLTIYQKDTPFCHTSADSMLTLSKVNLQQHLENNSLPKRTLAAQTSMTNSVVPIEKKKLLPMEKQVWTQYLGKNGDSHYTHH